MQSIWMRNCNKEDPTERGINNRLKIDELVSLCKTKERVYIYGAGIYGQYCLYLLNDNSIPISGFITTIKEEQYYEGIPILSLEEYIRKMKINDVIIPGYKGCTSDIINERLMGEGNKPVVADINPSDIRDFLLGKSLDNLQQHVASNYPIQGLRGNEWHNILLIRLDAIGDLVCTTAFIREIRENYPNSKITIVINRKNVAIVENCPYLDMVVPYDKNEYGEDVVYDLRHYESIEEIIKKHIQKNNVFGKYDVAILLAPVLEGRKAVESFFYMIFSGAKNRVGYLYGNDRFNDIRSRHLISFFSALPYIEEPMHETDFQLKMLEEIGLTVNNKENELWIVESDRKSIVNRLRDDGVEKGNILIAVGIVGSMEKRNWDPDNYRKLISLVSDSYNNVKWIVFGGGDAEEASAKLGNNENVLNYSGKLCLNETIACMEQCDIYVGANTGLLHIAASLKKPCITIYSVLDDVSPWDGNGPVRFGARDTISINMIPPAGLDGCHGSCKMKKPHCVNLIRPDDVYREISMLIDVSVK